jgi:hypothetical protein
VLSVSAVGLLVGCAGSKDASPPAIAFGEDVCDWCRMTIDDTRLAAAFVPASGRALRFGEPGCLLSWLAEHRDVQGTAYVVAREDGGWLRAPEARYARGLVRTPMAFDLAAWRGSPGPGDVISWTLLLAEGAPRATRG